VTAMRFDGRVAVVTGGGNGVGRAHCLELASRGARVVVNDLGGDVYGVGASSRAAEEVVKEIRSAGGEAVACSASVISPEGGEEIVRATLDAFGRLDILINNAGVLDTEGFLESSDEQIDRTIGTHLRGAFSVTRPALRSMLDAGYGRIVNTSSGAVLGSTVGLAYQAAKGGIIPFTRAVALIGAGRGVTANAVLPTAYTRMTDSIPDPEFTSFMQTRFTPERVAAAVALLSHESFIVSGELFLAGGGRMARLFLGVGPGYLSEEATPEDFLAHLHEIMATDGFVIPADRASEFASYLPRLGFGTVDGLNLVGSNDSGPDAER
jgi:NAD(P)-dependent dehydrogenase (short-subunit alcohol dehydrogenase family)